MKRIFLATFFLFIAGVGFAQPCTPNAPSGNPGVFPAPNAIPCIERNVPYSFTMQTENFTTFTTPLGDIVVNFTRIDSVENFPCGITWQSDKQQYNAGETGCIQVSGTTREPVGQYPLKIYMTMGVEIPFLGPQTFSGELNDLIAQLEGFSGPLGFDFRYVSRVIETGNPCPVRDLNSTLLASGDVCPPLGVVISGETVFCAGSRTLTATAKYEEGAVSYLWAPGGETTASISVSASDTYSVTVTDDNGSATASVNVLSGQAPSASFDAADNGLSVTFTNTTTIDPEEYFWDFGDPNSGTDDTTSIDNPTHVFSAPGTYTVTLTATSSCGSDVATQQITVQDLPCIPNAPSGNPGVFPSPNNIPCIERNTPYDFTMQVENFDSLTFNAFGFAVAAKVDFTRIDSVVNFPCGITWEASKLQYASGETGCIRVSGTSREIPGQYPVRAYITMQLSGIPVIGTQTLSGELNDLIGQLEGLAGPQGYDFKYVSRVIQPGASCPTRDINSTADASGLVCPPLGVDIKGNPFICSGQPTTLTAAEKYDDGSVSYLWSDNSTNATLTVSTAGTYSVTVSDNSSTASSSITVNTGTAPTAAFTATTLTPNVTTVNNTTGTAGTTTYSWNFGDNSPAETGNSPAHVYTSNGTFTITLTATNACGSSTATQSVTITGVSVQTIENNLEFDVFPNPGTGLFNLKLSNESYKPVTLRVFELSGKLAYEERIITDGTAINRQFDLSVLPKGVYALHLNSEAGNGIRKLVIF